MFDLSSLAPRIGESFSPNPPLGMMFRSPAFAQQQRSFHMKGDYENQYKKFFDVVSKIKDGKMEKLINKSLLRSKINDHGTDLLGDYLVSWEEEEAKEILGKRVFDILWKFGEKDFIVCGHKMFWEGGAVHVQQFKSNWR